jgi:hypothetical protein
VLITVADQEEATMSDAGHDPHPSGHEAGEPSLPPLPAGITASEHEFGGAYLFVTDDLLVAEEDQARLFEQLRLRGVTGRAERVAPAVLRVRLAQRADERDGQLVPRLVTQLRFTEEPIRVSPNHVLGGLSHSRRVTVAPPMPADALDAVGNGENLPGTGVTVAVLDTGLVDPAPAWFDGETSLLDPGQDGEPAVSGGGPLTDPAGHGTFVAGIVHRYAPGARILVHRVLDEHGYVDDVHLAQAIRVVADRGVDIINLSLGGYSHAGVDGLPATAAVLDELYAARPGLVVVAGAGNDATDRPFYPAAYSQVVAVAALGPDGQGACFSNYGPWVDCAAPGVDVVSTYLDVGDVTLWPPFPPNCLRAPDPGETSFDFNGWASWSGTSAAAPAVSGAIAAVMSVAGLDAPAAAHQLTAARPARRMPDFGAQITAPHWG